MASIKISRPNRLIASRAGNRYFKLKVGDKTERVVLDAQIVEDWDNILEVELDYEHYDNSMLPEDEPGKPTGPAFDRLEVIDYTTTTRNKALRSYEVDMQEIGLKLHKIATALKPADVKALADA
jgi:hypothetical protein